MPYDYANDILSGDIGQKEKSYDYASDILGGQEPKQDTVSDVNIVDTENPASALTHFKTGFVDNWENQLKIYSAARFPGLSEGERVKKYAYAGEEFFFKDDKGNWQRETPDTFMSELKRGASKEGAHLPTYILGVLGTAGGPVGSAAGAMLGEGFRKGVVAPALGEKSSLGETSASMVKEGVFDLAGYGVGQLFFGGGQKLLRRVSTKKGARSAAKAAGRDMMEIDLDQAERIRQKAKGFGIDLLSPQTTESKRLIDRYNFLGDLPQSADFIKEARKLQADQIDDAVYRYLDVISKVEPEPFRVGGKLVKAAKGALQKPVDVRAKRAGPIYKRAFEAKTDVDVKPVADFIDDQLVKAKGDVRKGLLRAKKLIMAPDLPKKTGDAGGVLFDSKGQLIKRPKSESYDTSLKGLHDSKMAIDDEISKAKKARTGNVLYNFRRVKSLLLGQMDTASPDYKKARKIFADYSTEVEKQRTKTVLGGISKLEGDQVINASRRLLASTLTSPETVRRARNQIMKQDPEAWNATLKVFMQDIFETIKESTTGDIPNLGGWMYKKLFGNKRQRRILQAAMGGPKSKQYRNLVDFMDVLRRTGMTFKKESATASRIEIARELGGIEEKPIRALTRPLYTKTRIIGDKLHEMMFGRRTKELAIALTNPDTAKQLAKLKRMPPKSEKLLTQLGVVLGLWVGHGVGEEGPEDDGRPTPIPKLESLQ